MIGKTKRISLGIVSFVMSMMLLLAMVPMEILADEGGAQDIVVTLTVSNKGQIAKASDGSLMAEREVTVKDLNSDGVLTFDEALVAAHAEYNSADGYVSGSYVTKLWGVESSNVLSFTNDKGLLSGVQSDTVKDGDRLVASINADDEYYADWYSFFDRTSVSVKTGESFTLALKGHLGMAYTEETMADKALSGISVGTLAADGTFTAIEGKTTDENGTVTLSFDEAGTYIISASGTVKDTVTNWNLMNMSTTDNPVYGIMDFTTYDTIMAYTDADYGDGPYPEDEIKWIDFYEWVEDPDSYNTLRSNQIIADCPIIVPVCIVTVSEASSATPITVYASVLGDTAHGADGSEHTLAAGNLTSWVEKTEISADTETTVLDVIEKLASENGLTLVNESGSYISEISYNGVTLGGGTNGTSSGWLYTINGKYSDLTKRAVP